MFDEGSVDEWSRGKDLQIFGAELARRLKVNVEGSKERVKGTQKREDENTGR